MSAWEIALDTQLDLRAALVRRDVISVMGMVDRGFSKTMAQDVFDNARNAIDVALPVYVVSDICRIWETAKSDFAPEILHPSDLLFPAGFAYLEGVAHWDTTASVLVPDDEYEGYLTPELTERAGSPIDAVLWAVDPPGERVGIWGFAYRKTLEDSGVQFEIEDGRFAYRGPDGPGTIKADNVCPMMMSAFGLYDFGRSADDTNSTEIGLAMQALWALMREFVPSRERVPRATRRRAIRADFPEPNDVTVIRLRRQSPHYHHDGESTPIEWDHRWIVRGHWRNQWHPSTHTHRQRFIAPYVKGPEDKPLRVTPKAVEFLR
jgi:hypothetical protein